MFGSATAPLLVLVVSGGRLKIGAGALRRGAGHPSMRLCPAPAVDRRDSPTGPPGSGRAAGASGRTKLAAFTGDLTVQLVTSQSVGGGLVVD